MSEENKKLIVSPENPNGILVDMTAEDKAVREQDAIDNEEDKKKQQAQIDLKASAKAKLMAGEPMTEEEANLTLHIL